MNNAVDPGLSKGPAQGTAANARGSQCKEPTAGEFVVDPLGSAWILPVMFVFLFLLDFSWLYLTVVGACNPRAALWPEQ